MTNYDNKVFLCSSVNDLTSIFHESVFSFKQYKRFVKATFSNNQIQHGELVGLINDQGEMHFTLSCLMKNLQVFGGNGTLKSSYTHPLTLQGNCYITIDSAEHECLLILKTHSFQAIMAKKQRKTC